MTKCPHKPLTPLQQAFVNALPGCCWNYRKAYYTAKDTLGMAVVPSNKNAVDQAVHRLVSNRKVWEQINALRDEARTHSCLTLAEKREGLATLARDALREKRTKAFSDLIAEDSKLAGHYAPTKTELDVTIDGDLNIDRLSQVEQLAIAAFRERLLPTANPQITSGDTVGKGEIDIIDVTHE